MLDKKTESNELRKSKNQTVNRRSVLSGITTMSLAGVTGLGAATGTDMKKTVVTMVKRPFNNPITVGEINKIRGEKAREFEENGGERTAPVFDYFVDSPNGRVVTYLAMIDADGQLLQSVGIANRERDVARAHREADVEKRKLVGDVYNTRDTTESNVTTQSDTGWTTVDSGKVTNYADPYGDLVDYYDWLQSDDSNDGLLYKERYAMFPGIQEYGYYYYNDSGEHNQQWSTYDPYVQIRSWEPFSGYTGTVSETVEVSGELSTSGGSVDVSHSYSYSQPEVDVDDHSSDRENYANWTLDIFEEAQEQTVGFDPASLADFEDGSPDRCVTVTSDATFNNGLTTETISNISGYDYPSSCSNCT